MKIKKTIVIVLILLSTLVLISACMSTTSYAGDTLYHFMQAHQDYIVIAKVVDKKSDNLYELQVSELITVASIRRDIPRKIEVELSNGELKKGDNIAISLSKRGGGYKLENGCYKVTTDDTDTLEVVSKNKYYIDSENAAVELFLKSRGKIKEFSFADYATYVHTDASNIGEDALCIYNMEQGKMLPTEYEKNEKYIIKGDHINLRIVIGLIIIFIAAQILVLYIYLKLNPDNKLKEILKSKDKNNNEKKAER